MSEYEYYTNLPYVNYCKMKGYEDRLEDEARLQRIAAFRIHQSLVTKPLSLNEFWPLPSDKKVSRETLVMSKAMLKKVKQFYKLKSNG